MQLNVVVFVFVMMLGTYNCSNATNVITNSKMFPAILIFGDSTMDTGNNNHIKTVAKANHPPYGEDFPGKIPTGRFSNGKLVADFIASKLGIKETVPPFLDPNLSDSDLITGVTFASAGSGFDDLTTVATSAITVRRQTELFRRYIKRIESHVGEEKAKKIIKDALVIISAGTNDFVFNFYDLRTRKLEFNITGYQNFILKKLQNFLKELYELGCRTMIIPGLSPIGCLPLQMSARFESPIDRKCLKNENSDAEEFNKQLQKLLSQMQAELLGTKILYLNTYESMMSIISNPIKYGFTETKRGCCGTGLLEAAFLCNPLTPTCPNHSQFVFWDSFHPTESVYRYLADLLYNEIVHKLLS